MITLEKVGKTFDGGKTHAVDELSLDVAEGDCLVLLGIGAKPAIVALTLYGLLPVIRNTFTDELMQELNYEVDEKKRSPRETAGNFLRARGLISDK